MSAMRTTMRRQPEDLRALLSDPGPAESAAGLIEGRRVLLTGTGTSWHAANHGAFMLRAAGVDAWAVQSIDAAVNEQGPAEGDALVVLSHTGAKRYSAIAAEQGRRVGAPTVTIGARGVAGVDVETVERETSSAYTASHQGALMRLAQIATALGAPLGDLRAVPDAVEEAVLGAGPGVEPPERLLELTGAGPNQWTAAEGALKARETAYIATEGLSVEQLLHGPAVALREGDTLVVLDGGGPAVERLAEVGRVVASGGARLHTLEHRALGEALSVFPLTAMVHRIALELAESLGTDPDSFGYTLPDRKEHWERVEL